MFDSGERKRLYKEARTYLSLRQKRKKYVAEYKAAGADPSLKQIEQKPAGEHVSV